MVALKCSWLLLICHSTVAQYMEPTKNYTCLACISPEIKDNYEDIVTKFSFSSFEDPKSNYCNVEKFNSFKLEEIGECELCVSLKIKPNKNSKSYEYLRGCLSNFIDFNFTHIFELQDKGAKCSKRNLGFYFGNTTDSAVLDGKASENLAAELCICEGNNCNNDTKLVVETDDGIPTTLLCEEVYFWSDGAQNMRSSYTVGIPSIQLNRYKKPEPLKFFVLQEEIPGFTEEIIEKKFVSIYGVKTLGIFYAPGLKEIKNLRKNLSASNSTSKSNHAWDIGTKPNVIGYLLKPEHQRIVFSKDIIPVGFRQESDRSIIANVTFKNNQKGYFFGFKKSNKNVLNQTICKLEYPTCSKPWIKIVHGIIKYYESQSASPIKLKEAVEKIYPGYIFVTKNDWNISKLPNELLMKYWGCNKPPFVCKVSYLDVVLWVFSKAPPAANMYEQKTCDDEFKMQTTSTTSSTTATTTTTTTTLPPTTTSSLITTMTTTPKLTTTTNIGRALNATDSLNITESNNSTELIKIVGNDDVIGGTIPGEEPSTSEGTTETVNAEN